MSSFVTAAIDTAAMKIIYKGELWAVVDDDGDGLWLESMGDPLIRIYAPYGSEDLNVDPTDDDLAVMSNSSDRTLG